jgi:hypothetical protein
MRTSVTIVIGLITFAVSCLIYFLVAAARTDFHPSEEDADELEKEK